VRKAGQKIPEQLEHLVKVRFVELEGAVKNFYVSFFNFEMETIEVWNAAIHTLDHLSLKFKKC
jgi:hypothetical protein